MGLKRVVEFVTCVMLAIMVLTTAASAAAVISSDNLVTVPSSGLSNYVYTVSGTGFAINAQVWVRSPTGVTYQVTETAWAIAGTYIRGYLTIPSSAAAGSYAVYVQNPGATAVYRTGMFTKSGSVATITGDSLVTVPASGWSGTYYVYGTGFASGAQVWVRSPAGVYYPATSETTLSPTTVRGTLVIPSSAAAGSYAVYVQNPGATAVYRTGMFTKSGSVATITGDSLVTVPASGWSGMYYVYGTGFASGAQVWVRSPAGVLYAATSETTLSPTTVRGTLVIPSSAAAGSYAVYVQNPGATAVYRTGMFTKSGSVATITGDSLVTVPASGWSGMYYVYGTGFASGAQVWVRSPAGVLYAATGETTLSPTTVRGTLVIPSSAAAGSYAVYVQNPGATAVYRTGMFTKSGSTPASISAFSPNYATRGVSKTVYVYGSNFQPGAQVIIYKGGATALQATSETFINSNTIRCVIYVSTSQPNGYYYGGVINPGMGFYPRANAFYLY